MKDEIEHYNMHRTVIGQQHPKELQPFVDEIRAFAEHCHYNVLHPILRYVHWLSTSETVSDRSRLLALGLELPEEAFIDMFNFDAQGETYRTWIGWSFEYSSHPHQYSTIHEVVSVKTLQRFSGSYAVNWQFP